MLIVNSGIIEDISFSGEPCVERVERKRRESEGDGGHGERATEVGMAFVPLPGAPKHLIASPRTLLRRTSATCGLLVA